MEVLVCGETEFDIADIKKITTYEGYHVNDPTIRIFWNVVCSMSKELQRRLLAFTFGSDRISVGGIHEMQLRIVRMEVAREADLKTRLPVSMVCTNQLFLPPFHSKKLLQKNLYFALLNIDYLCGAFD